MKDKFLNPLLLATLLASFSSLASANLSKQQLLEKLPEITRAVETHAGKSFKKPPNVVIVETKMEAMISKASFDYLLSSGRGISLHNIEYHRRELNAVESHMAAVFDSSAGFHDFTTDQTYILVYAIKKRCAEMGLSDEHCSQKIQFVTAHELVHALQGQHLPDLGRKMLEQESQEKATTHHSTVSWESLIEGHALTIQKAVAHAFSWQHSFDPMESLYMSLEHKRKHSSASDYESSSKHVHSVYQPGFHFFNQVYRPDRPQSSWWPLMYPPPKKAFDSPTRLNTSCLALLLNRVL